MKKVIPAVFAIVVSNPSFADMPLFAAKCSTNLNVDSDTKGQVYVNGKVAKLISRPDGQITATSGGAYIDITPQGSRHPLVTYTATDKSTGTCEILSFKATDEVAQVTPSNRASHSERAGLGQFDANGYVTCAQQKGQPMRQCTFLVARDPGGNASVKVMLPNGRSRFIFFAKGKAVSADLSQADGDMTFKATKEADLFKIKAGHERYEIPEAVVFGG